MEITRFLFCSFIQNRGIGVAFSIEASTCDRGKKSRKLEKFVELFGQWDTPLFVFVRIKGQWDIANVNLPFLISCRALIAKARALARTHDGANYALVGHSNSRSFYRR